MTLLLLSALRPRRLSMASSATVVLALGLMFVAGCSQLPTSGPSAREVQASAAGPGAAAIQVVDVEIGRAHV